MSSAKVNWDRLTELASEEFKSVPNVPGVYFVRWARNGKPVSISRLRNHDSEGILYIGSTTELRRRLHRLWKGTKEDIKAHTIAKSIIFCSLSEIVSLDEYEVSWETLESGERAIRAEWNALKLYASRHGEPPPLNLGLRRELFAIVGIARVGKSRVTKKF